MNILIFGITGILGNAIFRVLSETKKIKVYGTARRSNFDSEYSENIIRDINVDSYSSIIDAFNVAKPDVVINCVGIVKQLLCVNDPLKVLPINSMLPHYLAKLSTACNARFIQYSTDCVFSGKKGGYTEKCVSDCEDLYGKSKFIGEVSYPNSLTLRTSLIGHEISSHNGLLEWFLSQNGSVNGYSKAIFSGLTAYEHAKVLRDFVLPNNKLQGIYHLAASPISKYDLLKLVAQIYNKKIDVIARDTPKIDRSMDGSKFYKETGYAPPSWDFMIKEMYKFHKK